MSLSNQSLFVKLLLPYIKGYYVDIGSGNGENEPCMSNTAYLEEQGWTGLLLDYNETYIKESSTMFRLNSISVCLDATKTDYKKLFDHFKVPKVIDYLTIDVDANNASTIDILKMFPFNDYDFKILTVETDLYNPWGPKQKSDLVEYMKDKKYKCIVENVGLSTNKNKPIEDWYINPEYYSEFQIKNIENLFYKNINPNDLILDLASKRKT